MNIWEKIKKYFNEKREEKEELKKIEKEARTEAMLELKPAIKEAIKKQHLEKLSKPKTNFLQKVSKEFESVGNKMMSKDIGMEKNNNIGSKIGDTRNVINEDKIKRMLGK
jgi:polyribonucleotide nucleotidyltransferase